MAFWTSVNAQPIRAFDFKVEFIGGFGVTPESWQVKSCTLPSAEVAVGEYQIGNHTFKYPGAHKWNDVTMTFVDDKNTTIKLLSMWAKMGWINPWGSNGTNSLSLGKSGAKKDESKKELTSVFDQMDGLGGQAELGHKGTRPKKAYNMDRLHELAYNIGDSTEDGITKKNGYSILIQQMAVYSSTAVGQASDATTGYGWLDSTLNVLTTPIPGLLSGGPDTGRPAPTKQIMQQPFPAVEWELKNPFIKSINFGTHDYSSDELITIEVTFGYDYAIAQSNAYRLGNAYQ